MHSGVFQLHFSSMEKEILMEMQKGNSEECLGNGEILSVERKGWKTGAMEKQWEIQVLVDKKYFQPIGKEATENVESQDGK